MGIEYLEDGILFCGHFLSWHAGSAEVKQVAQDVASTNRCLPQTIERIIDFELKNSA